MLYLDLVEDERGVDLILQYFFVADCNAVKQSSNTVTNAALPGSQFKWNNN